MTDGYQVLPHYHGKLELQDTINQLKAKISRQAATIKKLRAELKQAQAALEALRRNNAKLDEAMLGAMFPKDEFKR